MLDPEEGLTPEGFIRTGARRDRVPDAYGQLLLDLEAQIPDAVAVYLYGSVATGRAVPGRSDLDVLAIGLDTEAARGIGHRLTERHRSLAREVAIGVLPEFPGVDDDESYGNRIFLRHYCVPLSGPNPAAALPGFRGDAAAARAFNGDLPQRLAHWRERLASDDPADLGRRIARKTLFAVAGLVSVHDGSWTTDRASAAERWGAIHPELRADLARLRAWADGEDAPRRPELALALDGVVATIAAQFTGAVGAWN